MSLLTRTNFQSIADRIDPLLYLDVREYLQAIYDAVKSEIQKYNYFQFSHDLGLSKSNVAHLILRGKRPLTMKTGEKILDALGLTHERRVYFENLILCQGSRRPDERQKAMKKLFELKQSLAVTESQKLSLELLSEWFYPALQELVTSPGAPQDAKSLAAMLQPPIRPEQARLGLKLLQDIGLLSWNPDKGRYESASARYTTGDEVDGVAVIRYHQKMIDLAKDAIFKHDESERDISAVTFSMSDEVFRKIKEEVQNFRKRMLQIAESDKKLNPTRRTYQLNFQLFPTSARIELEDKP